MSYPPATYHGSGEASARLTPSDAPPSLTCPNKERAAFMERHDTYWL